MVTGDDLETAVSIAKASGIILSGTNEIFRPLDNDETEGQILKKKSKVFYSTRFRCLTGERFQKHIGGLREEIARGEAKEVVNDVHAFRDIMKELRVLAKATP